MPDNELVTNEKESKDLQSLNRDVFVETPATALSKQFKNVNEAIDQSVTLIDSTANGLHSYMRGLFKQEPSPNVKLHDIDKVGMAIGCAKTIKELMDTKLKALQQYTPEEITVTSVDPSKSIGFCEECNADVELNDEDYCIKCQETADLQ